MWKKKKKNNHHIPLKLTLGTWTLASDQREAPPPAGGRRGRAVRLRASALLHMGVGEGDNLSVGALQVDRAVGVVHLLAAGARVHHRGGHLRVPGNEERGSSAKTPTFWIVGQVEATERALTWWKYCRLLHSRVYQSRGWIGSLCVSPLWIWTPSCRPSPSPHLFFLFFRWDTVSSAFVC